MFARSAAGDTLQGRAIHAVNERWGSDFRRWNGRETIGIPVCKKKYAPFYVSVKRTENGVAKVSLERMYGCHCHSHIRKKVIERNGVRRGWEPIGQWSLSKAKAMARKATERMNGEVRDDTEGTRIDRPANFSSDDERSIPWKTMCHNGLCTWKLKSKYDDIFSEIHNHEDEVEHDSKGDRGCPGSCTTGRVPRTEGSVSAK